MEHEGLSLLASAGFTVPSGVVVGGRGEAPDVDAFPGDRVVVKLLSPQVAHRTEVGGVLVVPRAGHAVVRALEELARRSPDPAARFLVQEYVPHEAEPGAELLLSARWTPEFGVVVTLALGGVTAEALAALARPGGASRIWSPRLADRERIEADLAGSGVGGLFTGGLRGRPPRVTAQALAGVVADFMEAVADLIPGLFQEIEINPLVFREGRPVALDALVRLSPEGAAPGEEAASGPIPSAERKGSLSALLRPASMAVLGASARGMNPGRVILRNTLAAGMDPAAVTVVKEGLDRLDGCRCVPDIASLDPVDVLVVSVAAGDVPAVLEAVVDGRKARGIILTSGGLGEGASDNPGARRVQALLARPGAPALNGGNCLGIRSVPGGFDTLFIPREKLGFPDVPPHPVALLSQSGAFAIARTSALPWLNPRFIITVGNQLDVTVGEWLEHLVDEPGLDVVACYVEGFRPGDGARFVEAARAHRQRGRMVLLYRGGRTPAGHDATASHTASVAGDYAVTRALAEAAGVLVAESVDDFGDLLGLAVRLHGRRLDGPRAGLISNAGFECVSMADNLGPLVAASLAPDTRARLAGVLDRARLTGIVAPRNPLDLTPMMGDEAFAEAVGSVLDDPGVDVAVVGCVPLTPALQTLPPGVADGDDVGAGAGVVARLYRLWRDTEKAWLVAVDAGPRFDPMARLLAAAGIPVVRCADRATRLLGQYAQARLGRTG